MTHIERQSQKRLLRPATVVAATCLLLAVLTDIPLHDLVMLAVLVIGGCVAGFVLGSRRPEAAGASAASAPSQSEQDLRDLHAASTERAIKVRAEHLRGILDELNAMQSTDDILERYHCLIRVIETTLSHCMGMCNVSLWCPDADYKNLVECVIRSPKKAAWEPDGSPSDTGCGRAPYVVPLDSAVIRRALNSAEPYLATDPGANSALLGSDPDGAVRCDACIPLYRCYGQPVIINVERSVPAGRCATGAFQTVVELIRLFWKQLQIANQRQWAVEHDEPSGALRDRAFLLAGQSWADKAVARDELFSLAVIGIRGFHDLPLQHSYQRRQLSAIVGRRLRERLTQRSDNFLIGKIADEVYAVMIARTDRFLAEVVMDSIMKQLERQLHTDDAIEDLHLTAVDIQWICVDHTEYAGEFGELLDAASERLFGNAEGEPTQTLRISLVQQTAKVSAPCR